VWCAQKKKKSDRKIKKSKKKDLTGPALLEMPPEEAFVVRARWVRFAKSLFFTARAGAVKPNASLYAASTFPTSTKARLSLEAGFSPRFSGCPSLSSAGRLAGGSSANLKTRQKSASKRKRGTFSKKAARRD